MDNMDFAPALAGDGARLRAALSAYQMPVLRRSVLQAVTTFALFFAVCAAMYALRGVSVWITLALSVPAAGLVVRIFIIQHDCGHGAFFRHESANRWMGRFCSLVTMTPFANWRRQHGTHHAVWNNLDRRTIGTDIYSTCLTVAEYRALSRWARWRCRAARHWLISQVLLPPLVFLFVYRVPFDTPRSWRRERRSVLVTNGGLAVVFTGLVLLLGAGPVALVQLPTIAIAAIIGVWLFSIQHRFEAALWLRQPYWTATDAALLGSSHLRLPRLLQWFSGNIGFHHIHHLMPRIPNYRLEECHRACAAMVSGATSLSLREALAAPAYALWDEAAFHMVKFSDVRGLPA
jgi:omega-6 fatty acid desaturase (delta-12 desaturase)